MAEKSMEIIVRKRLKWHRTERVLVWIIIGMAVILIPTGIGIYLYVDNLSITEYVFSVSAGNLAIFQVKMLSIFSRGSGVVFALAGLATIALARSRLSLAKEAYQMASFIKDGGKSKDCNDIG